MAAKTAENRRALARLLLAPPSVVLLLASLQSVRARPAAAEPTCTVSWLAPVSGSWTDPASWSTGAVPGSEDDACITDPGRYTVAITADSAHVHSLTLGATGGFGMQTLAIQADSCGGNAQLTAAGPIRVRKKGHLDLSGSTGACGDRYALVGTDDVLTSAGLIETAPSGGTTYLDGDLVNRGVMAILSADSVFEVAGARLTNNGLLRTAPGGRLRVLEGAAFTNGPGGSILNRGALSMQTGSTFNQGAGRATGNPVRMGGGTLNFTGPGPASFTVPGGNAIALTGHMAQGQALAVRADSCLGHAQADAAGGFSSAGAITLASAGGSCGPKDAILATDQVVTNTGTISTVGSDGAVLLDGSIDNPGRLSFQAATNTFDVTGRSLINTGSVRVAAGSRLQVQFGANFVNASGLLANLGTVSVQTGSVFEQEFGSAQGNPVAMDGGILDLTGDGPGAFSVTGGNTATVAGAMVPGQSLGIRGSSCTGSAQAGAARGFTNGGTITLAGDSGTCGDAFALFRSAGAVVNTGVIRTRGDDSTYLEAGLTNSGLVAVESPDTRFDEPGVRLQNAGAIRVAEGGRLRVLGGASLANVAGGSIANSGLLEVPDGGTFRQGAGATSGKPVQITGGALDLLPGGGVGAFLVPGGNQATVTGNVAPGQSLSLRADSCRGDSQATATAGFVNRGAIVLEGQDGSCGAAGAALALPPGAALTNRGTIQAETSGGGGTELAADRLDNHGVVRIDAGATLQLRGAFAQDPRGTFRVWLADPGSYGRLAADGPATLDGRLVVRSTFVPQSGQTFRILTSAGRTGTFSSVGFHGPPYDVAYGPTDVTLVARPGHDR